MKYPWIKRSSHDQLKSDYDKEIEALSGIVDELEKKMENNNENMRRLANDLSEAKSEFNKWKNKDGIIVEYEGIILAQEIVDKLLHRFDFFYMEEELEYPDTGLNLVHTMDRFYERAKTKSDKVIEAIERKHKT